MDLSRSRSRSCWGRHSCDILGLRRTAVLILASISGIDSFHTPRIPIARSLEGASCINYKTSFREMWLLAGWHRPASRRRMVKNESHTPCCVHVLQMFAAVFIFSCFLWHNFWSYTVVGRIGEYVQSFTMEPQRPQLNWTRKNCLTFIYCWSWSLAKDEKEGPNTLLIIFRFHLLALPMQTLRNPFVFPILFLYT